jgi:hypothetical protein
MQNIILNPTEVHTVFAWLPVLVFDRADGSAKTVWLQKVQRKLVSVQGVVSWSYSLPEEPRSQNMM